METRREPETVLRMPNAGIRFAYRLIENPSNFAPVASSCYTFESLLLTLVNRMIIPPCTILFGRFWRYLSFDGFFDRRVLQMILLQPNLIIPRCPHCNVDQPNLDESH